MRREAGAARHSSADHRMGAAAAEGGSSDGSRDSIPSDISIELADQGDDQSDERDFDEENERNRIMQQ